MAQVTEIIENNNLEKELADTTSSATGTSESEKIQKTKFQLECEDAYTLEEARQILYKRIEDRWKK